jgi:hypothetical protein
MASELSHFRRSNRARVFSFTATTKQKESRRCREERHAMGFAHIKQCVIKTSDLFLSPFLLLTLYIAVFYPILCQLDNKDRL